LSAMATAGARAAPAWLVDFRDCLDLDGNIDRQRAGANRRAGVFALVAEHLDHDVRGAVHDLGVVGELGDAIDEADELYDALDTVEIAAAGILELGDDVECADPRCLLGFLDRIVLADLALIFDLAVLERHLASRIDEV